MDSEPPREEASIKTSTVPDPPPDPRPQVAPKPLAEDKKDGKAEVASQEDAELKERLELAVERLKDPVLEIRRLALELLRREIRSATRCVGRAGLPPATHGSLPPRRRRRGARAPARN
jgi:hypothetical protein